MDEVFLDVELADFGEEPAPTTWSARLTYPHEPVVVDNNNAPWFDPHQYNDLTYDKEPINWGLFNKPISWMGYPPKEVRCSQCQRHMPGVTLPADVTSMVIFCDECRAMRDRSGS
jgi:hypothetical protein